MKDICETLNTKKSFILNMNEIDYNKLISFLDSMKTKGEKTLKIELESDIRKWNGYSVDKTGEHAYNKTSLS